jgi:uncharacterized membrane protein YeaQ/YmgE (transglycosylase-associated protein family)
MDNQVFGALGQPGVGFFMAIIIGGIAGWLAEKFTSSNMGILANILMGIIGAVVGNWLAAQFNVPIYGFWRNLISATLGAVLVIFIYRMVMGSRRSY